MKKLTLLIIGGIVTLLLLGYSLIFSKKPESRPLDDGTLRENTPPGPAAVGTESKHEIGNGTARPPGNTKDKDAVPAPSISESAVGLYAYLDPRTEIIFLETFVRERLSKDDLPELYHALSENDFAMQWGKVVFAICVLEDDSKALAETKKFISTPWNWQESGYGRPEAARIIRRISMSVVNLAMIDPELSGPFFQAMFSREGAEKFLESWQSIQFPDRDFESVFVEDFRHSAALGLLHTRSPDLFKVVEDEFNRLHSIDTTNRTLKEWEDMTFCEQVLGERELYREMGWDEGIKFAYSLSPEMKLHLTLTYVQKYRLRVKEEMRIRSK